MRRTWLPWLLCLAACGPSDSRPVEGVATSVEKAMPAPDTGNGGEPERGARKRGRAKEGAHLSLAKGARRIWSFGQLLEGEKRRHVFELIADGSEDLVIDRVSSNCGCTLAQVRTIEPEGLAQPYGLGTPIAPGTRIEVEVRVDSFGQKEVVNTTVSLRSNAADKLLILIIKGKVSPVLDVRPDKKIHLGSTRRGGVLEGELHITTMLEQPHSLRLDRIHRGSDHEPVSLAGPLEVEIVAFEPDALGRAKAWDVRLRLRAARRAQLAYDVHLLTDVGPGGSKPSGEEEPKILGVWFVVEADVR